MSLKEKTSHLFSLASAQFVELQEHTFFPLAVLYSHCHSYFAVSAFLLPDVCIIIIYLGLQKN